MTLGCFAKVSATDAILLRPGCPLGLSYCITAGSRWRTTP